MRTIIAGSRTIIDQATVERAIAQAPFRVTLVLSGDARGVDRAGAAWARARGIPVELYPADWKRHGRKAGILRNEVMGEKCDALIAVWDGVSRGTKHMIDYATTLGRLTHVYYVSASERSTPEEPTK